MKLSIITVNLNNRDGLQKTIKSIICQTSKDFEWIIIDGGSTDGSVELIEKYAKYITYWVSEPDDGIYNAMNKGIELAKGDYLNFMNSGDCYASNEIVKQFCNNGFQDDIIHANTIFVDDEGREVGSQNPAEFIQLSYFWSNNLNHQSVFYHQKCFNNYYFNEQNIVFSDKESYMYLLYNGFTFKKWNKLVAYCESGGISSSGNGSGEFSMIVSRILPEGIKADYDTLIKYRDVDLAIMVIKIIKTNKFWRYLTRLFLYPISYLSQSIHKK